MNEEELRNKLKEKYLFWKPEFEFAEENGIKLVYILDPFNGHSAWIVVDKEIEYWFSNFYEALDCFIQAVNK